MANPRVRKSTLNLTSSEWDMFKNAVSQAISEGTYAKMAEVHSRPYRMHSFVGEVGGARFLAWHRAYLLKFEELLNSYMPRDVNFGLPYWDWTREPMIPKEMAGFLGLSSGRFPGQNGGYLSREFEVNSILFGEGTFDEFTKNLELTPHNNVHVWVGGDMARVPLSPNDPIFWLHHAQIDRIWAASRFENPTINNGPTVDGKPLSGQDAVMAPWALTFDDVKDVSKLGYEYENPPEVMRYKTLTYLRMAESQINATAVGKKGDYLYVGGDYWPIYPEMYKSSYPIDRPVVSTQNFGFFDDQVRNGDLISLILYDKYPKDPKTVFSKGNDQWVNLTKGKIVGEVTSWKIEVIDGIDKMALRSGQKYKLRNTITGDFISQYYKNPKYFVSQIDGYNPQTFIY